MDTDALIPLLDTLPLAVQLFLLKALATIGTVGLFVYFVKDALVRVLGAPAPNDPNWKTTTFKALAWLDTLGLNSATFASLLELARKEHVIRTLVVKLPAENEVQAWSKTASEPPPANNGDGP